MFFIPKSPGMLLAFAAVGLLLGAAKGRPVWGLLLGAMLGPLGWGLILVLPRSGSHCPAAAKGENDGPAGPPGSGACPRCGKIPGHSEKACSRCGNVLIPVHYEVLTPKS